MISKTCHILCLISLFATTKSQTITDTFLPGIGDTILVEIASNPEVFSPGDIGVDQVWDFTNAIAEAPDNNSPVVVFAAEDTESFSSFPEATFAFIRPTSPAISYFQVDDNKFKSIGWINTSQNSISKVQGDNILLEFPLNFNESIDFNYLRMLTENGNSNSQTAVEGSITFDAIGTVHTPTGIFENCFRIKREITSSPNTPYSVSTTNYEWYKGAYSNKIAGLIIHSDNQVNISFFWATKINEYLNTNTEKFQELDSKLNYLDDGIFQYMAQTKGYLYITLIDSSGRVLAKKNHFEYQEGENQFKFQVSNFQEGIYVIILQDIKTGEFGSKKIYLRN